MPCKKVPDDGEAMLPTNIFTNSIFIGDLYTSRWESWDVLPNKALTIKTLTARW